MTLHRLSPLSAAIVGALVSAAICLGAGRAFSAGRAVVKAGAGLVADPDRGAELDEHSYLDMVNRIAALERRLQALELRFHMSRGRADSAGRKGNTQ